MLRHCILMLALLAPEIAKSQPLRRREPKETPNLPSATIIGRVERLAGVPLRSCDVRVVGTPYFAKCGTDGEFQLADLAPGTWTLEIEPSDTLIPRRRILGPANAGVVTDIGPILMTYPGSILGMVLQRDTAEAPPVVLVLDGIDTVLASRRDGTFTFSFAPSGTLQLQAYFPAGLRREATPEGLHSVHCFRLTSATVRVASGHTTMGVVLSEPPLDSEDDRICPTPTT